jgi:hypothetical protein
LQRYAAASDEAPHNYPATHFGRNPPQSNPATGSEEVLNLYPIKGAARYLTVGNFASAGRSLELAENRTFSDLASNVLIEPCHEPVQDLRTSLYACGSHPKMLYRVAAIYRSVTEADVFPY